MDIKSFIEGLEDIYEYLGRSYIDSAQGKFFLGLSVASFVLGFICLSILIYYKFVKGRLKPWDVALSELNGAFDQYQKGQGGVRQLYFDLTGIVKCLVEGHFKVRVLGKTDSEVLLAMKAGGVQPEVIKTMDDLFCRAQSVKFASQSQVQDQVARDVAMVRTALKKWALDSRKS